MHSETISLSHKKHKSSRKNVKVNHNTKTGSERKMTPQSGLHVPLNKKPIRSQAKIEYYKGEVKEAQDSRQESRSLIKFQMAVLKDSGLLSTIKTPVVPVRGPGLKERTGEGEPKREGQCSETPVMSLKGTQPLMGLGNKSFRS